MRIRSWFSLIPVYLFSHKTTGFSLGTKNILKATCRLELLLDFEAKCSKPSIDDLRSLWQRDSTLNKRVKVGYSRHFFAFSTTDTLFQVQTSSKFVTQWNNSTYIISCLNMKTKPFRKNFTMNLKRVLFLSSVPHSWGTLGRSIKSWAACIA